MIEWRNCSVKEELNSTCILQDTLKLLNKSEKVYSHVPQWDHSAQTNCPLYLSKYSACQYRFWM